MRVNLGLSTVSADVLEGLRADGVVCVEEHSALSADVLLWNAVADASHPAQGAGVGATLGGRFPLQSGGKQICQARFSKVDSEYLLDEAAVTPDGAPAVADQPVVSADGVRAVADKLNSWM